MYLTRSQLLLVLYVYLCNSIQEVNAGPYDAGCESDSNGITIYSETGTLSKPDNDSYYGPAKLGCRWNIEDQNNRDVIFFNLTRLSIEENRYAECDTDTLWIDNTFVTTSTTSTSQVFCGNITTPILLRGISNQRSVTLSSSRSRSELEFELQWFFAPICSNGPIEFPPTSGGSDELTSMVWPWYDGADDCQYLISSTGKALRLLIYEFTAEDNSCDTDYLLVVNANDTSEVWRKFCSSSPNTKSYYLPGPRALLTHHKVSAGGAFRLGWENSDVIGRTEQQRIYDAIASGCGAFAALVIIIVWISLKCVKTSPCYYKKDEVNVEPLSTEYSPPPATVIEKGRPYIMISYQWDVKQDVLKFKQQLVEAGCRVWIDVEQMHKSTSTFDAMTDAIEHAAVVVPVLTSKYQESVNCRKELEYADKSKRPIIPVRFEKKFKPTKWLSFLLGNSLWHDLSNPSTYSDQFQNFLGAVESNGAFSNKNYSKMEERSQL